jgi:dihydroflavonol-4-reductase
MINIEQKKNIIFITGGTGLIGSHLLYKLASSGRKIKALRREKSSILRVKKVFSYYSEKSNALFRQIEWVEGDILDYFTLERLLKDVNEVFHCAATVSFDPKDSDKMMHNNIAGTANIVNASLENKISKFCHVSSVAAIGNESGNYMVNEETGWIYSKKATAYSKSKFFSETEVWRGIEEGLNAIIINPSIVLGPGDWNSGSCRFFHTIWKGMRFYTKGVTGFVDVRDVVQAMFLLMNDNNFNRCKNKRFLLNSENLSYKTLFTLIADNLEKPIPTIYISNFLLAIIWRAIAFYSRVTRKPPVITHETASASNTVKKFDGSKITKFVDFEYIPVNKSIYHTASILKKEMQNS